MNGEPAPRVSLAEELQRLIDVLPAISELTAADPARRAWIIWKYDLLRQVRALEQRERELQSEPGLWIELARDAAEAAVFGIAESRDTPMDHR